jgi:cell division GTPase FtsZ
LFAGAGQAGSAIVDEVFGHKNMGKIATPLVFNSTVRDLQNLSNVGTEAWYGIAERHGLVAGGTEGFEERVTGGFGRNPVEADGVVEELYRDGRLGDAIDTALGGADVEAEAAGTGRDVPYAFVLFGLGGGTGCGAAPYIARAIDDYTEGAANVIAVCVLPNTEGPVGEDEGDGDAAPSRQAWNARYGLDRIEEEVDGIVLVDNQRLSYHVAAEGQFSEYNEYVASALVDLVSGPVLERIDPGDYEDVDPPIIDLRDVVTSLSFDVRGEDLEPGYASIGRAVTMTKSLPGYLLPFVGDRSVDSAGLSQLSESKRTLADASPEEAYKAIGLVRAPPAYVSDPDRGVETSLFRRYLRSNCEEINLGVTLTRRHLASFTTLFTYRREDLGRIAEIETLAEDYEARSEAIRG